MPNQNGQRHSAVSPWWRGGVIYQIYPRSFQDSNADGIGDLRGATARLRYLADLGVDAVWLSPFFTSPMKDFGYDISDYRDVDPIFGTLADFDAFVHEAHELGLKVMIDQVLSHCSDRHPWFTESRASRDNARADWFVWADPRPDGTPPNNWLSVFGGSAWQWSTQRRQYYLHNFLASQPDLNFHNPAVREAVLGNVRFWLDRGVDGFRLDAITFCFHDEQLRDNPPRGQRDYNPSMHDATPYAWQQHVYDKSRPENLAFLRDLRNLVDGFPGTALLGEIGDDDTLARIAEYTGGGDKLHMAYGFDLLGPRCDADFVRDVIERFESSAADAWPCWALSNHDVIRVASRWPAPDGVGRGDWLRLLCALQLSLRGSPCLYQGDELGLTQADVPYEHLQDPYGIEMWPDVKSRDGCRTPMVWNAAQPQAGFSTAARTWLPIAPEHLGAAAQAQQADRSSLHAFYKAMLAWRRARPLLVHGSFELLPPAGSVVAFIRRDTTDPRRAMLCAFNLNGRSTRFELPPQCRPDALDTTAPLLHGAALSGTALVLSRGGAAFAML